MLVGLAWFGYLRLRVPATLISMEHDMEEN
jgi:hypothetical protein